jgi:hypothetical protein
VAQDGTTKISTIRAKLPGEAIPVYNSFIGLEPDYSGENYLGDLQIDVQVSKAAAVRSGGQRSERRYAAVWHSSPWLASTEVHGLGPSEHLARCRALMAEEYRPASLSVADTGNSQTVAASVWIRPIVPEDDKEKLARRQTNAAVALLGMNRPEQVWPLLKHSPDPRVRSYLTHRLGLLDANAEAIVKRLDEEVDVTIRRALVLSLGEFDEQAFAPGARDSLRNRLREWYRTSDDPGLHAAAEWVLRQWKENQWLRQNEEQSSKDNKQREERQEGIRRELAKVEALPQWYVNGQGQTMVVIPGPVEYLMGSPRSEAGREDWETLHRQRIGRSFSLAAKLVSVEQFLRFRTDFDLPRQYAPASDCPVLGISWYQAAEYCNWLSKQEGLAEKEWCYEPNTNGRFEAGMKPAPDFLKRSGYRLPTEAEWEYVCRACALTSRHYGETEELLAKYGWYSKNSGNRSWPVGNLKPNDLGMFDMHGNAWEWCHDTHANYTPAQGGKAAEDIVDTGPLLDTTVRALRDGGFYALARHMRCANRNWNHPGNRNYANGFRIARTGQ